MNKLKEVAKKYGFEYKENYKVEWSVERDRNNNKIFIPLDEVLLAKNTDGKCVIWIYRKDNTIFVCGNTDNLNIWLSDTRKDLSADTLVEFCNELNEWADEYGWTVPLRVIIDPEDWQEIAGVEDALEDKRYSH